MTKMKLLSASIVAGSLIVASQAALAYEAGDILLRGGVAKYKSSHHKYLQN